MKKEHVLHCQFSAWYPLFRSLTIKSVILPLPQNVKDYLLDDGTLVVSGREDPPTHSQPDSDDEGEEIQWSDDENTATLTAPEFPEFTTTVQEAINSLGGSVFPKLNWSAPRDAYWIAMNSSLKCKTLSDIFLLFKSSDFITRDFTQPNSSGVQQQVPFYWMPPVCCWSTTIVSAASISSSAGVSFSLIGCPSDWKLICLIDKTCCSRSPFISLLSGVCVLILDCTIEPYYPTTTFKLIVLSRLLWAFHWPWQVPVCPSWCFTNQVPSLH
ncbi:hypothetical protein HJG60_007998 [Phyllostomus discolor]|uniref:Translation initiation factor eIF2 assembly protein n=1 Tax=Phyllostomus discolor TaxID=89673 RepID=A0A834BIS7_9CHIR|nr:hypothetical protein HJG60_007998 [Phyllostomus discolor]